MQSLWLRRIGKWLLRQIVEELLTERPPRPRPDPAAVHDVAPRDDF